MTIKQALGTTFSWNAQAVAELTNIGGVEINVEMKDVTSHDATDFYARFLAGKIDSSELPIEGNLEVANTDGQVAMVTDASARTLRQVIITYPGSIATWTFDAYITKLKIGDAPIDGVLPFSASIKIVGKPVFAISTSTGMSNVAFSNSGVVGPAFAIGTFDYVVTVLTGVTSVTVTPTAAQGVITVNDAVVTSGQASGAITLGAAGSVTLIEVVVTETGKAPKTYIFRVFRA